MTADMLWTLLGPLLMLAGGYLLGWAHGRFGWRWQLYIGIRRTPR